MRDHLLDGAPLLDERERALVADSLHSGNIVRGVANERQIIDHALRRNAESFVGIFHPIPLLGRAARGTVPGIEHPHARTNELEEIFVAGDDAHLERGRDTLWREGCNYIVGLEAVQLECRDAIAAEQLMHALDAGVEIVLLFVWQCDSIGLVECEHLLSPRGTGIVHPAEILWLVFLNEAPKELTHTLRHPGVLAARIAERRTAAERVERTVDEGVAVDQINAGASRCATHGKEPSEDRGGPPPQRQRAPRARCRRPAAMGVQRLRPPRQAQSPHRAMRVSARALRRQ